MGFRDSLMWIACHVLGHNDGEAERAPALTQPAASQTFRTRKREDFIGFSMKIHPVWQGHPLQPALSTLSRAGGGPC